MVSARAKAELAMQAAQKAQSDAEKAKIKAMEFAPEFMEGNPINNNVDVLVEKFFPLVLIMIFSFFIYYISFSYYLCFFIFFIIFSIYSQKALISMFSLLIFPLIFYQNYQVNIDELH